MGKRLNLGELKKRIDSQTSSEKKPTVVVPASKFLDTTQNINYQVMKAFDSLPWVQEASTNAVTYAIRTEKEEEDKELWHQEWRAAQINLQDVKKQSRIDNPQALFDALTKITKEINNDPVNRSFINDFRALLQSHHKNIYARVRDKLSYNQKNKVVFNTVMNALWNKIATHKHADFDWLGALKILKECWFTNKDQYVKEVSHKDSIKWYVHVDVWWINGIKVENANTKNLNHASWKLYKRSLQKLLDEIVILLDHHNSVLIDWKVSHWTTSTAYIVFKLLEYMGCIPAKKYDQILRFVKFIDIVDSTAIEVTGKDFDNSHKTLIGLQKLILKDYKNIDFIYDQFSEKVDGKWVVIEPSKTWLEILSDEYLENTNISIDGEDRPLLELSESKKEINSKSNELADKLISDEQMLQSPLNGESFIVDLEGKLVNAAEVANHQGCWVIKLLPDGKLYIYSPAHMQLDDKTWSTFGDYTRWHLLFIDTSKISDWSRFEKILFNLPENDEMLKALRAKIVSLKWEIRQKWTVEKEKTIIKSITHWAISKFATSRPPLHIADIQPWKEYDVVVNNIIDNIWVFITFWQDADNAWGQWKDANINGLIHKSKLTPKQMMYFKSLIQWENIVRITVSDVQKKPDWTFKIQAAPLVSSQNTNSVEESTKTW